MWHFQMRTDSAKRAKKMRCIFLILLCTSCVTPFEYDEKPNYFFATRRDTEEAICVWPNSRQSDYIPTFDLDKLEIPKDVGFKCWDDWLCDWELQNDTNMRTTGENNLLIAGNQSFHFMARNQYDETHVHILAANISLWISTSVGPRGTGLLIELDHLNETTNLKDTTLKYCDQHPEAEGVNCTIMDFKNGTNHLNYGNRWTQFFINFKENHAGGYVYESIYGEEYEVGQWTWNNATAFSYPLSSYSIDISVKSHQRNAALRTFGSYDELDFANNKDMKRNFSKRNSGKFCVEVWWNNYRSDDSNELLEVKNLASGRVEPATNTIYPGHYRTFFLWNHLDAGEYEITLHFGKTKPRNIKLCSDYDADSKIVRTWNTIPKAITKCQFAVGQFEEFSAWPSSNVVPRLKPNWTLGDWEHVCDRLGIGLNDSEVQIEFCNLNGCNYSKCPYLQHEHSHIFDF